MGRTDVPARRPDTLAAIFRAADARFLIAAAAAAACAANYHR
jgi:hypothetical protein